MNYLFNVKVKPLPVIFQEAALLLFPLNPNIHCLRTFSKSLPRSSADVVDGNLTHIHKVREYGENCLNSMLAANPVRINYMNRYQEIINDYNSEQDQATIEKTFAELMALANTMNDEQQRYVREGFSSDDELSIYDMLFSDNLSAKDIKAIKQVSIDLLAKVKAKIDELDHWTDKQETKAAVDNLIRDTLWEELPDSYDDAHIPGYKDKIYEYIYLRYGINKAA